jgi:hypothetical protein
MPPILARSSRAFQAAWILPALLAVGTPLAAQVNIESYRRDDPPQGLSGSLAGDVNLTTGNVDLVQINANVRVTHVSGLVQTLLVGQGGVGFLARNRYASSGLLHFRRTHWYRSWVAPEWYGQIDYDRSLALDYRMLGGGGVRMDFARGDWGRFGAGTSLMLEHERLTLPPTAQHDARTTTLRNSSFLTLRVTPGEQLVVSSTTYVQPALGEPLENVRVLENLRIATSLTERLQLTVTFDARYDSEPPDGIAVLDTRLRTGVTYTY